MPISIRWIKHFYGELNLRQSSLKKRRILDVACMLTLLIVEEFEEIGKVPFFCSFKFEFSEPILRPI